MNVPNVLITNFCNQDCGFCFAKQLMLNKSIKQEMSDDDFKSVIYKIKKMDNKSPVIKLLGGEPTLHSNFEHLVNTALKNSFNIQIFTNGIFSDKTAKFLKQSLSKIKFTFNVQTPGFEKNKLLRKLVIKRIKEFAMHTAVSLSFTVDLKTSLKSTISKISSGIASVSAIRVGISNPIIGQRNNYAFQLFPQIGDKLVSLISDIKKINPKVEMVFNCGLTRCMFTEKQYQYLKKNGLVFLGWGCLGKESLFDIRPDMYGISCYPLSEEYKFDLRFSSIKKAYDRFTVKNYMYKNQYVLDNCVKCVYYGLGMNQCPGPCLAFCKNTYVKATK